MGKRCPGYRDQLSLMFRDESSKVIQKAHAQWGTLGSPSDSDQGTSTLSEDSSASGPPSLSGQHGSSRTVTATLPPTPIIRKQEILASKIPRKVELNLDQRGLKFYMERYLFNHPDAPATPELIDLYFANVGAMQNVMIAVGLAGMSNLLGNKSMSLVARSKYVTALKQTGQLITGASVNRMSIEKPLRSIVTLALFEVGLPPLGVMLPSALSYHRRESRLMTIIYSSSNPKVPSPRQDQPLLTYMAQLRSYAPFYL